MLTRATDPTSHGLTPQPRGEEAGRHAGNAGEVSRPVLANIAPAPASGDSTFTAPPQSNGVGRDLGSVARVSEQKTIVRATSVLTLDLAEACDDPKAHIQRKCGGPAKCHACNLRDSLWAAQAQAARLANIIQRDLWRRDADAIEAAVAELGRWPGKGEWKFATVETEAYRLAVKAAPELASGIAAAVSHAVWKKWVKIRFDALIRDKLSPPHYRSTMPLPVRRQDYRIVKDPGDDGGYLLTFTLRRGWRERTRQFSVPITAHDEQQHVALDALVSGVWRDSELKVRNGELKLEADRTRPGRWYARVAYSRQVDGLKSPAKWAGINRGILCFLAAVTETGERWLYDGYDIEAYLKQVQRRRREYQRDSKASARWGHGRARTMKPLDVLEGQGERWRLTKCQTVARQFVTWIRARGVTHLAYEDFSGIRDGEPEQLRGGRWVWERIQEWPYYDLQTRIVSCCDEVGIITEQIAPAWITGCPVGGEEPEVDLRRRRLKCKTHGVDLPLDVAQAMNVLAKGRASSEVATDRAPSETQGGDAPKTGVLERRDANPRKRGGNGARGRRG